VEVVQRVLALLQGSTQESTPEALVAHGVDPGQRPDPERLRGPFGRGPHHDLAREINAYSL
jgi:hypothetical protein